MAKDIDASSVLKKAKAFSKKYNDTALLKKIDSSIREMVSNNIPVKEIVAFLSSECGIKITSPSLSTYIKEHIESKKTKEKNETSSNSNNTVDENITPHQHFQHTPESQDNQHTTNENTQSNINNGVQHAS